jgi:hypothetical protein
MFRVEYFSLILCASILDAGFTPLSCASGAGFPDWALPGEFSFNWESSSIW